MNPLFLFTFPIVALCALSSLFLEGSLQVICVCLSTIWINSLIWGQINRLDKRFVVYKFYVFLVSLQPIFMLAITTIYPHETARMSVNTTLFTGGAYTLLYSYCIVPLIALCVAGLLHFFSPNKQRINHVKHYFGFAGRKLHFFLFFGAFVNLLVWIEPAMGGKVGYFMRVLYASFSLVPLLAGYCWKNSQALRIFWAISIVLGLLLAVLTGSRAYGFFPATFYFVGFVFQLPKGRKIYALLALLVIMPIGLFVVGFIQNLRNQIGRKALNEVNISEVIDFIPNAIEDSLARGKSNIGQHERPTGYTGLERLVNWTLLFAPNMTPSVAEYRGYGDYLQEVRGVLSIGGSDYNNASGKFYPTVLFARAYGFNVHLTVGSDGRLKSYTVPFGMIPDAWSRYGLISLIGQAILAFGIFIIAEVILRSFLKKYPEVLIMGSLVMAKYVMQLGTYAVLITVKRMIVYLVFIVVVCFILRYIRKQFIPRLFEDSPSASIGRFPDRTSY